MSQHLTQLNWINKHTLNLITLAAHFCDVAEEVVTYYSSIRFGVAGF